MNRRKFICGCCAAACGHLVLSHGHAADAKPKPMALAACGLDCNVCGLFKKKCGGCHGPDGKVWSPQCKMRSCCHKTKKLSNCSECDSFPCEHVIAFENDKYAHHRKAIARLRDMHRTRVAAKQQPEGAR
jgi:hypothetical protein